MRQSVRGLSREFAISPAIKDDLNFVISLLACARAVRSLVQLSVVRLRKYSLSQRRASRFAWTASVDSHLFSTCPPRFVYLQQLAGFMIVLWLRVIYMHVLGYIS